MNEKEIPKKKRNEDSTAISQTRNYRKRKTVTPKLRYSEISVDASGASTMPRCAFNAVIALSPVLFLALSHALVLSALAFSSLLVASLVALLPK